MALVFIHSGYSPYLEFSLRQARAADPGADIVLLGDAANDRFPFLRHVDVGRAGFETAGGDLAAVYHHRSTNGRAFELVCLQRWFVLRAFLEAEGLADALVLDSDVMLYAPEAELRRRVAGRTLGVSRPAEQGHYRWMASPHVSYWTAAQADAYCAYVLGSYTEPALAEPYEEKWRYHLDNGVYGGICDMTTLYLYAEAQRPADVANFSAVEDGAACDQNLNGAENEWPDEYRMRGPLKELTWDDQGRPWGYNRRLGGRVRFQALHLQGSAKAYMPVCYRGARFEGQAALRRQLTLHYRARRMAAVVAQPARLLARKLGLGR